MTKPFSGRLTDAEDTRTHYVYRLFDAEGVLLYVGCSQNPEWRIRQYHAQPWARSGRSEFAWDIYTRYHRHEISEPFAGKLAARAAEREAIATEDPLFNKQHRRRAS